MKIKLFMVTLLSLQLSSCFADAHTIFEDINTYRKSNGVNPLLENKTLCTLAEKRVKQIKTDWSHDQFQPEIDNVLDMDGVFYENLARTLEPQQVVWGWSMSQAGHREAMLIPTMEYGCVAESDGHYVFEGYVPNKRSF